MIYIISLIYCIVGILSGLYFGPRFGIGGFIVPPILEGLIFAILIDIIEQKSKRDIRETNDFVDLSKKVTREINEPIDKSKENLIVNEKYADALERMKRHLREKGEEL
jgi:hypothetical protein